MKTAKQVREYVRRRWLQESASVAALRHCGPSWADLAREFQQREATFLEILNAFDTPHKTRLNMPKI